MPTGVYKRTEYHKRKISEAHKKAGLRPPSPKGRKLSEAHCKAISIRMKGRILSEEQRDKLRKANIGRKQSEETKIKRGLYKKGRIVSKETCKKISEAKKGNKSHFWKGGINPENDTIRKSIDYRLWREAVFARDNWTCQKTGVKGGILHPHHIKNFSDYPELRFAIDNGTTMSKESHQEFHKKYGYKNNNEKQITEFYAI